MAKTFCSFIDHILYDLLTSSPISVVTDGSSTITVSCCMMKCVNSSQLPVLCHWATTPWQQPPYFQAFISLLWVIVAQWQSTGGSSQKSCVRFPAVPLSFQAPAIQRSTDSAAPIVSSIRHNLYQSSDHGGVPSIGLLHKLWFHLDSLQPGSMHAANRTLIFIYWYS